MNGEEGTGDGGCEVGVVVGVGLLYRSFGSHETGYLSHRPGGVTGMYFH